MAATIGSTPQVPPKKGMDVLTLAFPKHKNTLFFFGIVVFDAYVEIQAVALKIYNCVIFDLSKISEFVRFQNFQNSRIRSSTLNQNSKFYRNDVMLKLIRNVID